jgi:16S rRNA C1402 (ribose-2'-O) methylase RsmI
MNEEQLPMNADTLNAMVDAMGALTMCLARQLTPTQKAGLAQDLARLSASMHATGNVATGRLLSDISRAAQL